MGLFVHGFGDGPKLLPHRDPALPISRTRRAAIPQKQRERGIAFVQEPQMPFHRWKNSKGEVVSER